MELKISYGNNRFSKKWSNKKITFDELCERFKNTRRTTETVSEYKKLGKNQRDDIKDVGGFVLGHLRGSRRKKDTIESRSGITLDADYANGDFFNIIKQKFQHKCVIYSTHKHTPKNPRYRMVIPTSREISADEYSALSRLVAAEVGMDYFDDSTYEPERLMYLPSTPSDGEYIFKIIDGEVLNPDFYLSKLSDWRDCSLWPTSSRQSEVIKREISKQQDPLNKEGVIGTFCRAYGIEDAINEFLSDVYAPSVIEGRYDYISADSSAGMVVYEDKWAYSHHATDPASNKLLNAFDLVRVHKFSDLDDKKSFYAMADFASKDEKVKLLILEERQALANTEFDDWKKQLQYQTRSTLLCNSLHNLRLILENDEALKAIVFNQLADGLEIKGKVPWKHPARFWRDADDAQLISYIDANYGTFSSRNYEIAVTKVADDRSYHPIREYLNNLPPWDGVPRIETLLIDYIGAEDNEYVKAVTKKTLCAAVARILKPGIKFDNILVLNGAQGVGKSTLISKLGGAWYSDSLALTDMNDKTAAEKLQGYWLLEIGELAGMRKADIDKVKAFISRQDDKYRASFGRRVTPHPRQCVFFGTTNSEKGYLRDVTGNRRFWTVKTPGSTEKQSWQLTDEDIEQIWAETLHYVKSGEKLYLDSELEELSKYQQREAMEQDEREGLVREYLDRLLPENWNEMDLYKRREYIASSDAPTSPNGVWHRQTVCNMEIWCECFGKSKEDMKPIDSYAIAAMMERIENWEKCGKIIALPIYGRQRIYERGCWQIKNKK